MSLGLGAQAPPIVTTALSGRLTSAYDRGYLAAVLVRPVSYKGKRSSRRPHSSQRLLTDLQPKTRAHNHPSCPDVERAAKLRERRSLVRAEPDYSFQWDVSIVSYARVTTPNASAPVHQCTWPPSWNTWPPKSSSWQGTQPGTTRRPVSSRGICNSLSATTRS